MKNIFFLILVFFEWGISFPATAQIRSAFTEEIDGYKVLGTKTGEIQIFVRSPNPVSPEKPSRILSIGNHFITALSVSQDKKLLAVGTQEGFLYTFSSPFSEKPGMAFLKAKVGKPIALLQFAQAESHALLVETLEKKEGRDLSLFNLDTPYPTSIPFSFEDHRRDLSQMWFIAYWEKDQVKILLPEEFTLQDFFVCPYPKIKTGFSSISCHLEHIN